MKHTNKHRGSSGVQQSESRKVSVSFPEKVLEFAERRAEQEFDGNLSLYVRTLIKKDRELAAK